jgi:hypothetical protein
MGVGFVLEAELYGKCNILDVVLVAALVTYGMAECSNAEML